MLLLLAFLVLELQRAFLLVPEPLLQELPLPVLLQELPLPVLRLVLLLLAFQPEPLLPPLGLQVLLLGQLLRLALLVQQELLVLHCHQRCKCYKVLYLLPYDWVKNYGPSIAKIGACGHYCFISKKLLYFGRLTCTGSSVGRARAF